MQVLWTEIRNFEGYSVSDTGCVRNDKTDRILRPNSQPSVVLRRDGRSYCKYLPRLVAEHWVPNQYNENFDTPIHLDGNRLNCHAGNLLWRPGWFATKFMYERSHTKYPTWRQPIVCVETDEVFETPHDVAGVHGVLEFAVDQSIMLGRGVFPDWLHFELI